MKRFFRWIGKWLFRLLLAWVLLSALLVVPLRWVDPPTSGFMLKHQWLEGGQVSHKWMPRGDISDHLALAVIAAEDQNFPNHRGFDTGEIRQAVQTYREGGRLRGASTISQQLARNLYLWPDRGWGRKGLELWFTVWLEVALPKGRMLEIYLNIVEFGPGIYGAEAASRHHFGQSAAQLSAPQAALLAAVLPAPRRFNASEPDATLRQRQSWILGQMANLGSGWIPEN